MSWHCFRLKYELHSPLHIGYHKVDNVQRTRYYILARNLWAAMTEQLTRSGFHTNGAPEGDYQKIGEWIATHLAFGYFFVWEEDAPLIPHYDEKGLHYGKWSQYAFERRYLSSHVTTALDAATTSTEEGSLHEVESIVPLYKKENGTSQRTQISGWVFLDEMAQALLGDKQKWLPEIWIGGERRYGFGRLRLVDFTEVERLNDYEVKKDGERPQVLVDKEKPLLAHTLIQHVEGRGMIELLVGRETRRDSQRFGTELTRVQVCWMPGSVLSRPIFLQIRRDNLWEFLNVANDR